MFFYLSKTFWWLFDPGNILFLLLFLGVFLLYVNKVRIGKWFCGAALIFYVVIGVSPVGPYLLGKLENRFPQVKELPENVDGIIILGGVLDVWMTNERQTYALNNNVERITSLINLTKVYPDVPIIFSGGAGLMGYPDLNEANMLKPLLKDLTKGTNRLYFENKSKNTYENAVYTKEIINELGGGKWILVTSASHIPRSVGAFRFQNIEVYPYPVNYSTGVNFRFSFSLFPRSGLASFRTALHEWLGLFVYYFTDKTSELFPAP